jgi:hypothetical protein
MQTISPFIPNPNASPAISMYQLGVMNTYRVEYNAEISRKEKFKVYPSKAIFNVCICRL